MKSKHGKPPTTSCFACIHFYSAALSSANLAMLGSGGSAPILTMKSIQISLLVLTAAVGSAAFSPASHRAARGADAASLFMNKKKQRSSSSGSKGFGGGASSSEWASPGSATALIKPKTTSNFRYAGSIRPGLQTPKRDVPAEKIKFPDYALDGVPKNRPALFPWVIEVKKPDEIEKMRAAGRCAREVLDLAGREIRPGITT